MKKLFALVLSLCLLCSLAMAETEATVPTINWSDFEDKAVEIGGKLQGFSEVGVDYMMFVPDGFEFVEVPADVAESGVLAILSNGALTFSVAKYSVEGMTGEQFIQSLQEANAIEIEGGILNGKESVSYVLTTEEGIMTANVAIPTDDGKEMITFTFAPANSEENLELLKIVAASIQAIN